jgi:hypothetical protein
MPIWVPTPVAGRPRVFLVPFIDLLIIEWYQKSEPGESANFPPGSNPRHEVIHMLMLMSVKADLYRFRIEQREG